MADTRAPYQQPYRPQQTSTDAAKGGPSAAQIVAVIILVPLGGLLLTLAGLTFAGTVIGLAVSTPVFILFSPVLVPAALIVGLSMTGFLTSGAFGLTGMSSLAWILNYLRQVAGKVTEKFGENVQQMPDYLEGAKKQIQGGAGQVGQRTKEMGQQVHQSGKEAKESQKT